MSSEQKSDPTNGADPDPIVYVGRKGLTTRRVVHVDRDCSWLQRSPSVRAARLSTFYDDVRACHYCGPLPDGVDPEEVCARE